MSKYEMMGVIAEMIIIKEREIKNLESKPETRRTRIIIDLKKDEIAELKEKLEALV